MSLRGIDRTERGSIFRACEEEEEEEEEEENGKRSETGGNLEQMGWLWACLGGGGPTSKEQRHCSKTFIHHQSKVSGEISLSLSLSLPCYSSDPSPPHSLLFFFTVLILNPHCRECKGFFFFFCSLAAIRINPQCIIAPSYPDQPSEHVGLMGLGLRV